MFDPGSTLPLVQENPYLEGRSSFRYLMRRNLTLDSPLRTSELINSHDIILSEFDKSKQNDKQDALNFD